MRTRREVGPCILLYSRPWGLSRACSRPPRSLAEPTLAKAAPQDGRQQHPAWYRGSGDVQVDCVERSFSISVGNPAYPNRLAIWPALADAECRLAIELFS